MLPVSFYNGDLQLFLDVDQLPHLEVPYPLTNGGHERFFLGTFWA